MQKKIILISTLLFLVIFLSIIAYAVGSSTGGSSSSVNSTINNITSQNQTKMKYQGKNCETQSSLTTRIECRLEQKGIEGINITEESCRVLANPKNCQSLYAKVASCYTFNGIQKDQCFKRIAGFIKSKVKDEASANNKEALRNYIVFLLYDLQEKIENSYKLGDINSTQASETIALIVKIKQDILLNKTKSEIRPEIQELKTKIKELNI